MISLPRKPTEVVMTLGLGLASFYMAFFGRTTSNPEGVLLIIAGLIHLYFFKQVLEDKIILYGWSLISFVWSIPAFFTLWIFIRELS